MGMVMNEDGSDWRLDLGKTTQANNSSDRGLFALAALNGSSFTVAKPAKEVPWFHQLSDAGREKATWS